MGRGLPELVACSVVCPAGRGRCHLCSCQSPGLQPPPPTMRGAGVWNPGPLCVPREFLLCNQTMTGVRGEAAGCPRGMGLQLGLWWRGWVCRWRVGLTSAGGRGLLQGTPGGAAAGTAGAGGRDEPPGPVLFSRLATPTPLGTHCRVCEDSPCRMQRKVNRGMFAERPGCCWGPGPHPWAALCSLLVSCQGLHPPTLPHPPRVQGQWQGRKGGP